MIVSYHDSMQVYNKLHTSEGHKACDNRFENNF